jgi:hypothetical protein
MKPSFEKFVLGEHDLKAAILEVKKYSTWYNQTAVKMKVTNNNSYDPPVISAAATVIINEWLGGSQPTPKAIDDLITALEDFSDSAPRVTVTLAAPAPNSLKQTIALWFRENIAPNTLVNFKFNSTILGGMVVVYGSRIYDWSFRRQILVSREKFPEVLRNV